MRYTLSFRNANTWKARSAPFKFQITRIALQKKISRIIDCHSKALNAVLLHPAIKLLTPATR